jgi:hypothetical protein
MSLGFPTPAAQLVQILYTSTSMMPSTVGTSCFVQLPSSRARMTSTIGAETAALTISPPWRLLCRQTSGSVPTFLLLPLLFSSPTSSSNFVVSASTNCSRRHGPLSTGKHTPIHSISLVTMIRTAQTKSEVPKMLS